METAFSSETSILGTIFNIMHYAVNDGPGIRTTVFFKGCPLRCAWCHNPESISPTPEIMLYEERCLSCGQCIEVCPQKANTIEQNRMVYQRDMCQSCGRCVSVCPAEARTLIGRPVTVKDVMEEVRKDRLFFDQSRGGVTFSGGEPLYQADFLLALIQACIKENIHTVVDTCGYAPWKTLNQIAELTHLLLFDLKIIDEAKHRLYTGVSNRLILENMHKLDESSRTFEIRIPLIPGINDQPADIDQVLNWIRHLRHLYTIHLLPYHHSGEAKYQRLGRTYTFPPVNSVDSLPAKEIAERLEPYAERVIIGG